MRNTCYDSLNETASKKLAEKKKEAFRSYKSVEKNYKPFPILLAISKMQCPIHRLFIY